MADDDYNDMETGYDDAPPEQVEEHQPPSTLQLLTVPLTFELGVGNVQSPWRMARMNNRMKVMVRRVSHNHLDNLKTDHVTMEKLAMPSSFLRCLGTTYDENFSYIITEKFNLSLFDLLRNHRNELFFYQDNCAEMSKMLKYIILGIVKLLKSLEDHSLFVSGRLEAQDIFIFNHLANVKDIVVKFFIDIKCLSSGTKGQSWGHLKTLIYYIFTHANTSGSLAVRDLLHRNNDVLDWSKLHWHPAFFLSAVKKQQILNMALYKGFTVSAKKWSDNAINFKNKTARLEGGKSLLYRAKNAMRHPLDLNLHSLNEVCAFIDETLPNFFLYLIDAIEIWQRD